MNFQVKFKWSGVVLSYSQVFHLQYGGVDLSSADIERAGVDSLTPRNGDPVPCRLRISTKESGLPVAVAHVRPKNINTGQPQPGIPVQAKVRRGEMDKAS